MQLLTSPDSIAAFASLAALAAFAASAFAASALASALRFFSRAAAVSAAGALKLLLSELLSRKCVIIASYYRSYYL